MKNCIIGKTYMIKQIINHILWFFCNATISIYWINLGYFGVLWFSFSVTALKFIGNITTFFQNICEKFNCHFAGLQLKKTKFKRANIVICPWKCLMQQEWCTAGGVAPLAVVFLFSNHHYFFEMTPPGGRSWCPKMLEICSRSYV